jgi:dTDP-4-amino-4,6-dideoxygalactose transaminase
MTLRTSVDRRPGAAPTGSHPRVPFADPGTMTHEIRAQVETGFAEVVDSRRSIDGDAVERCEQARAGYCGTGHAVVVAEGTDAQQLALRAHDVGPGAEVVVPANTSVATAGPRPPGGPP